MCAADSLPAVAGPVCPFHPNCVRGRPPGLPVPTELAEFSSLRKESAVFTSGAYDYDPVSYSCTFTPGAQWHVGEIVTVILTTDIVSGTGIPLAQSYLWNFRIGTATESPGFLVETATHPIETFQECAFAADFNGDDYIDVVSGIAIRLNDGTGNLAVDSVYSTYSEVNDVIAADLDNDGDMDVATYPYVGSDQWLNLYENTGDGVFDFWDQYWCGYQYGFGLAEGDFNGDGCIDLITLVSGGIALLLNQCDGTFAEATTFDVGHYYPISLAVADIDNDGDLDAATGNSYFSPSSVSVLLNDGQGNFAVDSMYAVGEDPRTICFADLNNDGAVDLVASSESSPQLTVRYNLGDGTFSAETIVPDQSSPGTVAAGDITGDGYLDLASDWYVFRNTGDGSMVLYDSLKTLAHIATSTDLCLADFDNDEDLDLAVPAADDNLHVFLNQCDCGDQTGGNPNAVGDIDCDSATNPLDIQFLVQYVYLSEDARCDKPACSYGCGDVNCSGGVDPLDVQFLVQFVYQSLDALCEPCAL